MKFCLLFFVFLLAFSFSYSQVFVGNVDINRDEKIKVIEVMVVDWTLRKNVRVFVDYGQKSNLNAANLANNSENQKITDPVSGKEKVFVSAASLLNFMESNNWEHYNSVIQTESNSSAFFYYFRKKCNEGLLKLFHTQPFLGHGRAGFKY
ncbi:hypothetical protein [Dyadobacter sp. NIV53]|uniref:hypothetical protein n=1 Tax=Dyadobacter sp. NIV53 TaxID=2861765 RepID=UPI001C87EC4E|nr:hypothetical protein [Dyadobacter sp. NIV53]